MSVSPKRLIVDFLADLIIAKGHHNGLKLGTSEECMGAMFMDPRENGSLLLTAFGWDVLKDEFPHWSVELPSNMTFGDHTFLVDTSIYPYYFFEKSLITFDADLGVMMKLVSGDFVKMKRLRRKT